jgi:hypothetical protein
MPDQEAYHIRFLKKLFGELQKMSKSDYWVLLLAAFLGYLNEWFITGVFPWSNLRSSGFPILWAMLAVICFHSLKTTRSLYCEERDKKWTPTIDTPGFDQVRPAPTYWQGILISLVLIVSCIFLVLATRSIDKPPKQPKISVEAYSGDRYAPRQ